MLQHPGAVGRTAADVGPDDFTHPTYRAVWEAVAASGGPAQGAVDPAWVSRVSQAAAAAASTPESAGAVSALAVEPLRTLREPDATYVSTHVHRLLELTAQRRIADVKSRLQRTNPVEQAADYNRMFGELVALEQHRRTLREQVVGPA